MRFAPRSRTLQNAPSLVSQRTCAGCTLCCELLAIKAFDKAPGVLCSHCSADHGCTIYEQRPEECRTFYCAYRTSTEFGEEWRPADCGLFVYFEGVHNRINVMVDPASKAAWRNEPYFSKIRSMAIDMLHQRGHLLVWEGLNVFAIMPDREIELGVLGNRSVVVMGRTTTHGEEYNAMALAPDDPLWAQFQPRG